MFEWSTYIMKKTENGESLDERALRQIEVALRMYGTSGRWMSAWDWRMRKMFFN